MVATGDAASPPPGGIRERHRSTRVATGALPMLRAVSAPAEDAAAPTPRPSRAGGDSTGGASPARPRSSPAPPGSRGWSASSASRSSRYYFGTVGPINAFEVAFLVPNTVRALVADAALSSAFVPVFSELLEKGERKRAWRVASSLFWLDPARPRRADRALHRDRAVGDATSSATRAWRSGFSRVLFPIVLILGLTGIVVGDPEQLRALLRAGAVAGALERRDHRRPRDRRPAARTRSTRSSTSTRSRS